MSQTLLPCKFSLEILQNGTIFEEKELDYFKISSNRTFYNPSNFEIDDNRQFAQNASLRDVGNMAASLSPDEEQVKAINYSRFLLEIYTYDTVYYYSNI